MKRFQSLVKLLFTCGLFLILVGMFIIRQDDITSIVNNHILNRNRNVVLEEVNDYYRDYDFLFVHNVEEFTPTEYQDLLDIYYTVLNSGQTSFTFYCSKDYKECIQDVQTLANDQELFSNINNYVHPYNGFSHIETEYDTLGRITINTIKSYTNEEIAQINEKVEELYPQLVKDGVPLQDNIRSIHDYIINHTRYDSNRSDNQVIQYKSDIAYGALFDGYALCGGYTDLMEIFLEKMNVKSFKASSEDHVWNVVLIGDRWYHLDLTWDDPVSSDGKDYLEHNYFLISTNHLLELEPAQHQFNLDHYPELKQAMN